MDLKRVSLPTFGPQGFASAKKAFEFLKNPAEQTLGEFQGPEFRK